jgi:protein SCO1
MTAWPFGMIALAALLAWPVAAEQARAAPIEIGGPFTLTDQNGQTRSDRDFLGSYMLIYFGYTSCPDACPTALLTMTNALAAITGHDARHGVQVVPIFITVDPKRDTAELVKEYAAHFSPRLIALRGDAEALWTLGNAYGARFAAGPVSGGGYLIDHTNFIYLMGPNGTYIQHFESDATAQQIADAIKTHVASSPGVTASRN